MLDLDALEALLARATPGEWASRPGMPGVIVGGEMHEYTRGSCQGQIFSATLGSGISPEERDANAVAVVMCHNAAPALIAELRELRAGNDHDLAQAVQAIDYLMGEINALKALGETLQAANRWRTIAEGLPEERLSVLIYDDETINKAFKRGGSWYCDVFHGPVTHWLPLPDPPEGL
jgi:hypothetical protein